MQFDNKIFDDVARVAGGAMGALAGFKAEVEQLVKSQFERLLSELNLVSRDEFEAVQAMAAKARAEQESLAARLAVLEAALADPKAPDPAAPGDDAA